MRRTTGISDLLIIDPQPHKVHLRKDARVIEWAGLEIR